MWILLFGVINPFLISIIEQIRKSLRKKCVIHFFNFKMFGFVDVNKTEIILAHVYIRKSVF